MPTIRGNRWVPPAPATVPILALVIANDALFAATRRSQARASSRPPVKQKPSIAAIVGFEFSSSALFSRRQWFMKSLNFLGEPEVLRRIEIHSGGEELIAAGKDDAAHFGVVIQLGEGVLDFMHHLETDSIALFGPVESQDCRRSFFRQFDCRIGHVTLPGKNLPIR